MASPSITQEQFFTGSNTGSFTFKCPAITTDSDSVCMALCFQNNSGFPSSVISISSATGEIWFKRKEYSFQFSGIAYTICFLVAPLGLRTTFPSENITIGLSPNIDGICAVFFGVTGMRGAGQANFDNINPPLPFSGGSAIDEVNLAYQTMFPDDLLICIMATNGGSVEGGPVGFTGLDGGHIWPTNYTALWVSFLSVSTVQNTALAWNVANIPQMVVLDAFTSDLGGPGGPYPHSHFCNAGF